ncbi:MAG TPA: transposase [Gaiellaceae bacterium]|jgi:REP element-mobilizing transposase RayT|nr:transposase [Gaiellaceae bacterium]
MPRTARCPLEPGFYHLTTRGNRDERIFLTGRDRTTFCGLVEKAAAPETFLVRAYCLMSTHYHLLVETETAELSAAMRDVNGVYARWFNKEHGLRGRLFEERFHSEHVEDDQHLLEVLRYLALNPVRAGLALTPTRWRWGSFAAVMGHVLAPSFLDVRWTLRLFSNDASDAKRQFSNFVKDAPDKPMS